MDYIHSDQAFDLKATDIGSCAVLVIDELGEVRGTPLEGVLLEPTLRTASILKAARERSVPVIYCNDAHYEGIDHELELWGRHGIAGSEEAQPSSDVAPQKGDFIIEKPKYSSFYQTRLRSLLHDLGVGTLILTGFDTNICVRHTAADAYFEGFNIIVVEDATGTFLIGTQEDGLDYMRKCYAADIVSTQDVLDFLID